MRAGFVFAMLGLASYTQASYNFWGLAYDGVRGGSRYHPGPVTQDEGQCYPMDANIYSIKGSSNQYCGQIQTWDRVNCDGPATGFSIVTSAVGQTVIARNSDGNVPVTSQKFVIMRCRY